MRGHSVSDHRRKASLYDQRQAYRRKFIFTGRQCQALESTGVWAVW